MARAKELVAQLGVEEIPDHATSEASGGQQKRVGIARALVNDPDVVFGDEPTGALNCATTAQILDILSDVNARGKTLVIVTHDATVAARADRVLVLVDGRIADDLRLGRWTLDASAERQSRVSAVLAEHGV